MTHLHVLMEIDTCPMCGGEIYAVDNGHLGKPIQEIPLDAVFEFSQHPVEGKPGRREYCCGKFVIKRRDPVLYDNDWVCEYIPSHCPWEG